MKRSRVEIIMAVLDYAMKGAGKTQLMYKVNMNLASFNRYLRELIEAGLIVEVNESTNKVLYKTTKNGMDLLKLLKRAEEFISL
jgi:predicted transcriptional regulator